MVNFTGVGASVTNSSTRPSVASKEDVRTKCTATPPETLKEQRSPSP